MFTNELEKVLPDVRAFARMLCRDREIADDAVQNACLKAWSARQSFDPDRGTFKSWMFTITRNEFLQIMRKKRPVDFYAPTDLESQLVEECQFDRRADCSDAIGQLFLLPPEQRDVFILVVAVGYSYEEAAEICRCEVGTIKSRINRARAKLRATYANANALEAPEGGITSQFHEVRDLIGYAEALVQQAA